jgi:hypothetical protein
MRKIKILLLLALMLSLVTVSPAAANGPTGSISIYSVAVCKDTALVTTTGTTTYATNRVRVRINAPDSNGAYYLHKETYSGNFGSGDFVLPLVVSYSKHSLTEGALVYVDVQLQAMSGDGFIDVGPQLTTSATVTDRLCKNKCAVTVASADKAPANGVITLRTHYGSLFRPEGRLYGVMPVTAGQRLQNTFPALPCHASARIWYYPATGKDRTPKLLTSQYWPDGFGLGGDAAIVYSTSFAKGVKATAPLEPDDPYAPKK